MKLFKQKVFSLQLIFLTFILFLIFLTSIADAGEASRNLERLKGKDATAPSTVEERGETKTPDAAGEAAATPGHDDKTSEPIRSPAESGAPAGLTDSAKPSGWENTGPPGYGWNSNPDRGKPLVNIPLYLGSLLIVCILAYGALKLYSIYAGIDKASPAFQKKLIRVRERNLIAPGKQICVVELPGKTVLISICDNEIKILTELDPEKILEIEKQAEKEIQNKPSATSYLSDIFARQFQRGNK